VKEIFGFSTFRGYYSPAADAIGAIGTAATIAAVSSNRPKSEAEIDYQERKDRKRTIDRQIRDTDRELKRARKSGDQKSIDQLNKQKADLQEDLRNA
jgi:uncharacterized membrane protein (DUF106 family)